MKPTKAQERELAELERRRTCIHEAAHAAVCGRFGGVGVAQVWRNTSSNVRNGEKAWRGTFKMYVNPGQVKMDDETRAARSALEPPENWQVLVGLAGLVAEKVADGVTSADEISLLIQEDIDAEYVSPTDLAMMGTDWNESDVACVLSLLLEMWLQVERDAIALRR